MNSQTQVTGRVLPVARQHVQRPGDRIVLRGQGQHGQSEKPGPTATVQAPRRPVEAGLHGS